MGWWQRVMNWIRPQAELHEPPPPAGRLITPIDPRTPEEIARMRAHRRRRQGGHVPTQANITTGF